MRTTVFVFLLLATSFAFAQTETPDEAALELGAMNPDLKNAKENQQVYLDLEAGQYATIYNAPGLNYLNCTEEQKCNETNGLAWPTRQEKLIFTGHTTTKKVQINSEGEMGWVEFAQVKFNFVADSQYGPIPRQGDGWIATDRLRLKKYKPVFKKELAKPASDCCTKKEKKAQEEIERISDKVSNSFHENIDNIVSQLKGKVGNCALPIDSAKKSRDVPYDRQVLPGLLKEKWPRVEKESVDGKKTMATTQDFIAIDAVARTLYGEMAQCHRKGLQYPMAVARVIQNRASLIEAKPVKKQEFCGYSHSKEKDNLAQVATQPIMFSTWNKDQNIKHPLCPPSDAQKPFYTGRKPPVQEVAIWNDMVRIATEMVLFPENYKKNRTPQIKQAMHYVSYVNGQEVKIRNFQPFDEIFSIEGRKIANKNCLVMMEPQGKYKNDYKLKSLQMPLLDSTEFAGLLLDLLQD